MWRVSPEQLVIRGATHETAWWSCSALPRRALARARFATTRLAMSVAGFDNGASGRQLIGLRSVGEFVQHSKAFAGSGHRIITLWTSCHCF